MNKWWQNFQFFPHLTEWLPSVQNIIGSILAKRITNASVSAFEPVWHIVEWRACQLLTLKRSACITFAFPTALNSSFLAQTVSIKPLFSPCSLSSCFLIHTSLHSAQPQGSSSLYNALRKGRNNNEQKKLCCQKGKGCVSYLGSLRCRTTNSQVYRIYSL